MQAASTFTFYYMFQLQHCSAIQRKKQMPSPSHKTLTLLSFHPRPDPALAGDCRHNKKAKTAFLQPSGSDTSIGSELPRPFNPSRNFFCGPPPAAPFASPPVAAREARAKRATTALAGRKKKFWGVFLMDPPKS